MKPEWKYAPSWAQYLAQDSHGAWGWYEHKPVIMESCQVWDIDKSSHRWQKAGDENYKPNPKWFDTLEARC